MYIHIPLDVSTCTTAAMPNLIFAHVQSKRVVNNVGVFHKN